MTVMPQTFEVDDEGAADAAGKLATRATWRARLVELGIVFAVLLACEFMLGPGSDLAALSPHPFWIPVLLMAAQHGTVSALVAAGVATFIAFLLGPAGPVDGGDSYAQSLAAWREPVLWTLAALVFGEMRRRQMDRLDEAVARTRDALRQRRLVTGQCRALRDHVRTLEHRLAVDGAEAGGSAIEVVRDLVIASPATFQAALERACAVLLGASEVSVIAVGDAGEEDVLVRAVVSEGRVLSAAREEDVATLGSAAFAAPVVSDGEVVAVLRVRDVDPGSLSPRGAAAMALLAFIAGQRPEAIGLAPARPQGTLRRIGPGLRSGRR